MDDMSGLNGNGDAYRVTLGSSESWTDDLPICVQTGVGSQSNQMYRRDGSRQEFHACEDKSFHFCVNKQTYFYGLFDGHGGHNAANFLVQHLPAEVLLGQLTDRLTDSDVHQLIQTAFNSVEREYFQSIDNQVAEKASLELQIQGMSQSAAYQMYPEVVDRLKTVTAEVACGTAALIALVYCNRLHVANVGDSKAILCKMDTSGGYTAIQLSTDHDLLNDHELSRLSSLGVDVEHLGQRQKIGNVSITRCIGNYLVKGAYQEFPDLVTAKDDPVIADPAIKSMVIDDSFQFLILASGALFRALEDATDTRQVNSEIVRMVAEEFQTQNTLTGVAQAVINKICRLHQDQFLDRRNDPTLPQSCRQIEDLTLMVRNFNHPLVKGMSSPSSRSPSLSSMHRRFEELHVSINEDDEPQDMMIGNRSRSFSKTLVTAPSNNSTVTDDQMNDMANTETTTNTGTTTTTNTTTNSTDFEDKRFNSQKADPLVMDADGRIESYVAFDDFSAAVEVAKSNGTFEEFVIMCDR